MGLPTSRGAITRKFVHPCGNTLIPGDLWNPDAWPEASRVPSGREIVKQMGRNEDFIVDLDAQVLERYKDSL